MTPDEPGRAGVQPVLSDDKTAGQDRRTTSPSVPVESREQPSGLAEAAGRLYRDGIGLLDALAERDTTIRELRAELEAKETLLRTMAHFAVVAERCDAKSNAYLAERDRARDLAAHLEEDSERLQEQLEAVRALAADPCLGMGCTANCREHIDALDVLAILEGK